MTELASTTILSYLKRLERATRGIPSTRRGELLEEIEQHLAEAIPADASEGEIRTALDRLGTPEQIAIAERDRLGIVLGAPTWAAFGIWALIGATALFGFLIFGMLAIVPIAVVVWLAATRPPLRRSGFGSLAGIGLSMLYIAYVGPRVWLIGIVLIPIGVVAHARRMRVAS